MILLWDDSQGAGHLGANSGNNYALCESISGRRGLGYGWLGLVNGDGYGMDENVTNDIAFYFDPLTFEHLITNAALSLTWMDK